MTIFITKPTLWFFAAASAMSAFSCRTEGASPNPVEVGVVGWGRDADAAFAASRRSGKPVFLLFQEVPGCSGCKDFGREVLSDPEIARRIEADFIPLLVHNNRPGKDAALLERFGEPAWNFQVVRFVDAAGKDLIPREDGVNTRPELSRRMDAALAAAGRTATARFVRVAFAQSCFWTGELKLGAVDGVLRTEAGFFDGREVTLVDFDPATITLFDLTRSARASGVADRIHPADAALRDGLAGTAVQVGKTLDAGYRKAPASDQKRQLQGTRFAGLMLDPEQATKVNAFARPDPRKAESWLTPEQRELVK